MPFLRRRAEHRRAETPIDWSDTSQIARLIRRKAPVRVIRNDRPGQEQEGKLLAHRTTNDGMHWLTLDQASHRMHVGIHEGKQTVLTT